MLDPKDCYHILNGDALADQFPPSMGQNIVVFRECLIEGPVQADSLSSFFENRAAHISDTYPEFSIADYYTHTVHPLDQLSSIAPTTPICLWFEQDLFCQTNFWFLVDYIQQQSKRNPLYWICPPEQTPWGFGGLDQTESEDTFRRGKILSRPDVFSQLWKAYQNKNLYSMLELAQNLEGVLPAVQAHVDRYPDDHRIPRPQQAILDIHKELETDDFAVLFRAFCERQSIYGFGDSQFKRLLDQMRLSGQLPSHSN